MKRTIPTFLMRIGMILAIMLATFGLTPGIALAANPTPVALEFNSAVVSTIADTGFTTVLPGTNAADLSKLTLNTAAGRLQVQATGGDIYVQSAQDNALAIQYGSEGTYSIGARFLGPLPINKLSQSAGIFIATGTNSYIRATIGIGSKRTSAERIQLDVNDNGKLRSSILTLPPGTIASATQSFELFLTVDHTTNPGRVSALYRINSSDPLQVRQAASRALPRWMKMTGNTPVQVHGGIISTSGTATSFTINYDWFRLTDAVIAAISGFKSVDKDGLASTVNPGDILTYTISITNNSTSDTFRLTDPIPVDAEYVPGSLTAANRGTASYNSISDSVNWQGTLGPNQSATFTFQVQIHQPPLQSATVTNQARLVNTNGTGLPALLSASTVVDGAPDLSDSTYITDPTTVGAGDILTFKLNLTNSGTVNGTNASATLDIPAGTTYVAGSATATSGTFSVNAALSHLIWNASGPITPTQTIPISFQVKVGSGFANGAAIIGRATLQSTETLPSIETAQANFATLALIDASKTVDKLQANPGERLTYTISMTNNGSSTANLQLTDPLPPDITYVTGSVTGAATYDLATNTVSWQGNLTATQAISFTFQADVNLVLQNSASIVNQATLSGYGTSLTLLSATSLILDTPDLTTSVYDVDPLYIDPNGVVTFTLNLENSGSTAALTPTATLSIPDGMTYVNGSVSAQSGTATYDSLNNQITWSDTGALKEGQVLPIRFQAKANSNLVAGTILYSTANFQADGLTSISRVANVTLSSTMDASSYSADPASIGPNDTLTYTLALQNDGTLPTNNASATFSIPSGTTYVPGSTTSSAGGTFVVNNSLSGLTWTAAGPIAANTIVNLSFKVKPDTGLTSGTLLESQATIQSSNTLPTVKTAQATFTIPASISASKSVSKSQANPNDTLTYTIQVTNNGGSSADLQIDDPLPADLTYVASSATDGATYDANNNSINWQGTLAAGETTAFIFQARINAAPQATTIVNQATLTSADLAPILMSASTRVLGTASLAGSTYTASPLFVNPSGTVTYTLNLQNGGSTAAISASATLTVPTGMTFVNASETATSGSVSYNSTTKQITWTATSSIPASGSVKITFKATANANLVAGTTLASQASFKATSINPLIRTAQVTLGSTLNASTYTVSPSSVGANGILTFTLDLKNDGTLSINNASATMTIPTGTTYVAASASAPSGTFTTSAGQIVWNAAGSLAAGSTTRITFKVKAGTGLSNGAILASQATLQSSNTLTVIKNTQASFVSPSSISASKIVNKLQANPGDTLTYTIRVKNNGGTTANLQLTDPLPANLTYVAASVTAPASYNSGTNSIIWQASLGAGQSISFTFQAKIKSTGLQSSSVLNQATLTGAGATPTLLNASTTILGVANLSGSIYTASPTSAGPGTPVTFKLNLLSNGNGAASGATASLSVPTGMTYVAASATAGSGTITYDSVNKKLNWTAGAPIPSGTFVLLTFQATPNSNNAVGATFTSTAAIQASGLAQVVRTAQVAFIAPAIISATKVVNKTQANPGEILTYTFTIKNTGGTAATLQLTDPLPANTTYVAASVTAPATYNSGTNSVTWQGSVAAGQTITFSFQAMIKTSGLTSTTITNQATLTRAGANPITLNASTAIVSTASFSSSTYIVSPLFVAANGAATFKLNLQNNGTGAAYNAKASLSIPNGMTYVAGSATASNGTITYDSINKKLNWTASGSIAAGGFIKITFQATANSNNTAGALLSSSASIQATGLNPLARTASLTFGTLLSTSTYAVSPATVGPNGTLTFVLDVKNNSSVNAANTTAIMTIPSGTTYVAGSATGAGGTFTTSAGQIIWNASSALAPGSTTRITFKVKADSNLINGTTLASQVTLQSNGLTPTIKSAQATFITPAAVSATMSVNKTQAIPGDTLTYTINARNDGGTAATVQLTNVLPANVSYVAGSVTAPATYNAGTNSIIWQASLGAGQSVSFTFQVKVNTGIPSTTITNQATLTRSGASTLTLSAATTITVTPIGTPRLSNSTYTSDSASVKDNDVASFHLTVLNDGTAAASGATASMSLPNGMVLVAGSATTTNGSITFDSVNNKLIWTASSSLAIGQQVLISFQATIDQATPNGTILTSNAIIQATGVAQVTRSARVTFTATAPTNNVFLPIISR